MRFTFGTPGAALLVSSLVVGCADTAPAEDVSAGVDETAPDAMAENTLTADERAAGWMLLFDGESTNGWRGYNQNTFPEAGWAVDDGDLMVFASDGSEAGLGGDIVSLAADVFPHEVGDGRTLLQVVDLHTGKRNVQITKVVDKEVVSRGHASNDDGVNRIRDIDDRSGAAAEARVTIHCVHVVAPRFYVGAGDRDRAGGRG